MNQKNLLKGSIIALLCVALIAGIVLSVAQPDKPDDDRLSNVETRPTTGENSTPTDGPDVEPPLGTGPAEPHDPIVPPTVPPVSQPEPKPTEPAPVVPEATEPDSTEPEEPENKVTTLTGNVSSENSTVTEDTFFGDGDISVMVPAGAQLEDNTTSLTLTITEKDSSDSGVQLDAGQTMLPLDVHIEGISAKNTAPITISLGIILPKGLNIGNYSLYHVENGVAVKMNAVPTANELSAHNDFVYNPADGNVIISVHSFSEIALVSEESAWEGNRDYTWYDPNAKTLYIRNADQLAAFGAIVGGMVGQTQDSFAGKTVVLWSDINLNDSETDNKSNLIFYPIGYWNSERTYEKTSTAISCGFYTFEGTFDGNGNTISNFYQNTWEMKGTHDWYDASLQYYRQGMGLFGKVYGGTVKNLTVDNFSSDGEITTTGVIAAYADSANGKPAIFENISIVNCNPRVYNIGNGGIVGCAGWYSRNESLGNADYTNAVTFRNITVDQTNKISALWGTYDASCGGILGQYYPDSGCGLKFENCHVAAIMDVNNDVCANYQYYWYRYSGMLMGTVRANTKDEAGYTVANTADIKVENCTYTYGSWNEYWYCELVKNSSASYTHDYQFSRLTTISSESEIQDENGNWNVEGNFVIPTADKTSAVCYHIFKDSNGNLYRHLHTDEDESNNFEAHESFDVNNDGKVDENDLKEDRTCYYIPFGQVLNGLGYGVKPTYEIEGFKLVEDGSVLSGEKFELKDGAVLKHEPGAKIYLKDLFNLKVNLSKLSQSSLYVAASPANEESTITINYSRDNDNWENNYFVISEDSVGSAKIVITDYFYCQPTVIEIEVVEREPVEKFATDEVSAQNAYTQITLGYLFSAKDGATIGNVTATVTDPNGNKITIDGTSADWAAKTIDLTKDGEWTVVIKDNDENSKETSTTFTVNKVDKFEKKFNKDFLYRVGNANDSPVPIGKIFSETDTAVKLSSVNVEVTKVAGNVAGIFTSGTPWTDGTIQFSGTGVVKVTISADGANAVELNLEVVDAVNATVATDATANNVVLLNDIGSGFTVSGRYTVYGNGFTLNYTGNGQYLNNGLKQGVVTVSENGTLDNLRITATIYPNAYMYYGSTVLGDYVQGGPSSTEGDKTRYHYQLSAVVAKGNATIQNCYIYGGRANIFVDTGDVTVKDTILECGVVANMQIQSNSSHTITLENVTTIQHQVNPTMGDTSKIMLGAGIIIGPDTPENPKIVLNGDFKQYNWVTSADADAVNNTVIDAIINAALDAPKYNHTVNGKTASNLGIIYMNTAGITVENNTGLPYEQGTVTLKLSGASVDGQVYSVQGATANQIYSDCKNADRTTVNGLYAPQFKYPADLGGQYIAKTEDGDEYLYREGDTIHVMFPSGDSKEVDLAALVNIVKYTGQDLNLQITCKDSSGNPVTVNGGKVTLSSADTYTVTYTVTDTLFFDKDGNKVENSHSYSWDVTVEISLKDNAVPNARFDFDATKQKMGYYKPSWGDVKQYLPFLAGLKIYDYNGQTEYLRFDGDKDFNKVASIVVTNKYSGNDALVVVTLTDGGVIQAQFCARADSGGASTYTGKIKTSGSTIYFVNDGGTSNSASTTTSAYWYVDYYKFTGNNGMAIQSAQQTFTAPSSSASTPSGNFSTTIKYTVSFDANGGDCGQTTGYATSASAAVTLPTPKRSGYILAGWYTAASGGTRVGGAGDSYTPSANITLYAQWGKPCTVTYNANGGNCDKASEKYTGTALTLPTATRDGYWFIGWYDAATGGNKVGDAGATFNPTNEITLYAHWQEQVEYTVTYNANSGTCGTQSATYQGTALTLPTASRTGYTFNGWYDAATGGNKVGDAGALYTPTANITLYAQWQINSYTIKVTTNNATVKVNGTTVNNNGTVSIQYGAQVTVEVTYSQSDDRNTTIKGTDGTAYTSPFTMPAQNVTINATSSCITGDTLVTLADGTQVRVDQLTGDEMLLVWNLETGRYDFAPIVFVDQDAETEVEIITLTFSDGSEVKVIYEHGFFDYDLGKYVYLDAENAESYIGHRFVTQGDISGNTWNTATLTGVTKETKVAAAYSPVTFSHLCYYVDGVLSMPGGIEGLFNIFDVDTDTMAYDAEKKAQDIEKYGLYTFEDFAGMIPEEAYYAFNGAYLKVAIGKGLLTWEDIAYLAERYVPLM